MDMGREQFVPGPFVGREITLLRFSSIILKKVIQADIGVVMDPGWISGIGNTMESLLTTRILVTVETTG